MALTYTASPFNFVDSIDGTASAGNVKNLVPIAVDRRYHREVQKKLFFKTRGMIGPDTKQEGDAIATAKGFPIVRKTVLQDQPGDSIRVGLRKNLSFGINTGKTGADQLVDNEVGWDFDDLVVKIEQLRQAVMTDGGINRQRNPYESFEEQERSLLSNWAAQIQDTAILYSIFAGYAPHLFRERGTTAAAPTVIPNMIVGDDETLDDTRAISTLRSTGDDNISARSFELMDVYMSEKDFDKVDIEGDGWWMAIISPRAASYLLLDDRFRNAMLQARERGRTNPLFRHVEFTYNNFIIYKYDKVRTVLGTNNPAALTVGSKTITEVAYTLPGGITAAQHHQMICFGANAGALAEGFLSMADRIRAENDYGNIIGRGIDGVWGTRRYDFRNSADDTTLNQSVALQQQTLIV